MEKFIKDGKVAVLISPNYGAGWSTWAEDAHKETLCMDARLVYLVLDGRRDEAASLAKKLIPEVYTGGAKDLTIEWVTQGQQFEVEEYDGYETIHVIGERGYLTA